MEQAVTFQDLAGLNRLLTRLVLDHDGLDDQGAPNTEPTFATDLIRSLSRALRDTSISGAPDRAGAQAADLLLRAHPDFEVEGRAPLWVVRVDHRGLPLVRYSQTGTLYSPFVDTDDDGLADANDGGQLVDIRGDVVDTTPFGTPNESGLLVRDAIGRAIAPDGNGFVFDYVDLNETSSAFLLEQNAE